MITSLHIKNYKSLKDVDLRLGPFTVLVGANAAGKTNFVDCLDFLGRCFANGLTEAVGAKGGYENICFRRARRAKSGLAFHFRAELRPTKRPPHGQLAEVKLDYEFAFRAVKETITAQYEVTRERIRLDWLENGDEQHLEIDRGSKHVVARRSPKSVSLPPTDFIKEVLRSELPPDELFLASRLGHWLPFRVVLASLSQVGVYQVSPASAREPGDPSGRKELGRTGGNLPAAIQHLKKTNAKAFEELLQHLQRSVATVTEIETDYVETKQLGLFLREKGVGRRWYANDLSDGTLRTLAIFVPLLDARMSLVAIEEPENSIHPWVIKDFIETCRKCSTRKQVILTTHSPVLVSNLEPSELYLVDRQEGATRVFPALDVDRSLDQIISAGIQDLGDYWNSGQMSAVPSGLPLWALAKESGR